MFFSGSLGGESSPPRFYISPPKFGVANDSVIRMCNTTAIFELFPPQHSYPRKNTVLGVVRDVDKAEITVSFAVTFIIVQSYEEELETDMLEQC